MSTILTAIARLIYPPRCSFCGRIMNAQTRVEICEGCFNKIPFLSTEPIRLKERGILPGSYCDELLCACSYTGIVRQTLLRFKFYGKASVFRGLAAVLAQKLKVVYGRGAFDIIIPVPLHKDRFKVRGYNQSELISRVISRFLCIPLYSKAVRRCKQTQSQSLLGKNDRLLNIKNAFTIADESVVKGKRVLLVDDILTTGSTLNECGRVLRQAGAASVTAAVVATGRKL